MKKFLFTLAAMLMSVSAFANCYLYVDPDVNLEDLKGKGEQVISLQAHFDVYCSAWQLRFDIPQGVTITYAEPGTDMKVPYKNAKGRDATVDVSLSANETFTEFLAAIMVGGYWQDPNGEDPTAWVTYGVVKWEPGDYENMVDLYVEVDDSYDGGDLVVWTTPSSGTDTRGATCKDNGDEAREQTVPEDQPVEKKDVIAPVITPTVNATTVTVVITWPETDGEQVYTGEYTYERPAYGEADQTYEVEAYTKESDTYKESEHATATITVPAQDPVWQDVVAPVITPTVNATTVTVEITWPTSDGEKVYTGQYTYDRPAYGEADQTYQVEAYTTEKYPYRESAHATATINVPAQAPVWQAVAAPVITTTMDDENVYVTIEWPTTTGNHVYNGEYSYARGEQDATYDVEAYTEADYPYSESTHATFTVQVPAKEQVTPPEPGEDNIYVKFNGTELPVGKKIIFVYENGENSLAMGTVGTKGAPVAVVVANGEVNIANTEVVEFTVGGGEVAFGTDIKQYTLEYSAGFLAYNSSTNFKTLATVGEYDTEAYWRLQTTTDGYTLNNANATGRYIRKHATNNNFGPYAKTSDSEEVVIYVEKTDAPALQDLTGKIVVSEPDANGVVTVTYTGDEDVTITVNGQPVAENYQLEDGVPMTFDVVVSAQGYNDLTASETRTWNKPVEKIDVAAPVITTETTATQVIVTIAWPTTDGEKVYTGQYTYDRPAYGEAAQSYDVEAYTKESDTYKESAHATYTVEVPAQDPVWQDVAAPVITTTMDENNVYVHVAWPTSTGEQIFEGEYTYPRGDEDYSRTVVAYTAENYPYRESAHATLDVSVPKKVVTPPTSIEEILNSENVASVRYFNMAGQEMQQAEGMTIVVVTYTNGTTSAIKVMK